MLIDYRAEVNTINKKLAMHYNLEELLDAVLPTI